MVEIKTTGLKGVYNRIHLFSTIMKEDVFDITAFVDVESVGYRLASNRVMLVSRVEKLIYTGNDLSVPQFLDILSQYSGKITSRKELNNIKQNFYPEFNTGTYKIGDGYRGIANKIMLIYRAESFINNKHDILHKYTEILEANSASSPYMEEL